jgi:hypothetical protein
MIFVSSLAKKINNLNKRQTMKKLTNIILLLAFMVSAAACGGDKKTKEEVVKTEMEQKVEQFTTVKLDADISHLSENEKKILSLLFDAAEIIDELFWMQAYGDKDALFAKVTDEASREFLLINYGPWERLDNNEPFIEGYGPKPLGANFYPTDMTKDEFDAFNDPDKASEYTLIRRDEEGNLKSIWYHIAFADQLRKVSDLLLQASELAEDEGLKKYLELRAKAILTDDYFESDMAWMDMRTSNIEVIIGPIEHYEDRLYGNKTAYEAFVLIKDNDWSEKLYRFNALLPKLQANLPIGDEYKKDKIGTDSDINVYEAVLYKGDCNAGGKTIAINLPNDIRVHQQKGSRKLQLKNSMKAKFDHILIPICDLLIAEDQRKHVTFDAFFENTTFHEVAHGLGIKNTINGKGPVREALMDAYTTIEEGKADILGLYMVTQLYEMGEISSGEIMDNYVTFVAGIFRSSRFGASSAHGKANMIRFNYYLEREAISLQDDGTYRVNFEKIKEATLELATLILTIQGDGDYERALKLINESGNMSPQLKADLEKVNMAGIPVDIRFEQGKALIGLE